MCALHETLEVDGAWWLPEKPGREVPGTLRLTPKESALVLRSSLYEPEPAGPEARDIWEQATVPTILGRGFEDRKKYTVLASSGLRTVAPFDTTTETWNPRAVLVGEHIESPGAPTFDEFWAEVDHLDEWSGAPTIQSKIDTDSSHRLQGVTISAQRMFLFVASVDGARIGIEVRPEFAVPGRSANLRTLSGFVGYLPEPSTWQDLLNRWVAPLQELVALGTATATRIVRLFARPSGSAGDMVEVRFRPSGKDEGEERHAFEIPFRAGELPGGFYAGLNAWWDLRQAHRHTLISHFALLHSPFTYLEDRFVAVVRMAEAFHATQYGATPEASAEQAARVQRVLEATADLDADDRAWLEVALEASQVPVARARMSALLSSMPEVAEAVAGGDVDHFARALIQTRNLITHPQSAPGAHALIDTERRFWYSEALLWFVRALLMREIGFSEAAIPSMLGRSQRYSFVLERMDELVRSR